MPRATNNITTTEHIDLKSCPDGYVELRKMTYGQYLERQALAMDMQMQTGKKNSGATMDINMAQRAVAEFEFRHCVAGHNLEDEQGNILDFKNAVHVHLLDPQIGQEIGENIDRMNSWEEAAGN